MNIPAASVLASVVCIATRSHTVTVASVTTTAAATQNELLHHGLEEVENKLNSSFTQHCIQIPTSKHLWPAQGLQRTWKEARRMFAAYSVVRGKLSLYNQILDE